MFFDDCALADEFGKTIGHRVGQGVSRRKFRRVCKSHHARQAVEYSFPDTNEKGRPLWTGPKESSGERIRR
jgi:hypothetical protein